MHGEALLKTLTLHNRKKMFTNKGYRAYLVLQA